MLRPKICFLVSLLLTLHAFAESPLPKETMTETSSVKTLRILLEEGAGKFEFHIQGAFLFQDLQGKTLLKGSSQEDCWLARVLSSVPASQVYSVLVASFAQEKNAIGLRADLLEKGYESEIETIGLQPKTTQVKSPSSMRYRVLVGRFSSVESAQQEMNFFKNQFRPRVLERRLEPARGLVEFASADFTHLKEVEQGFRILVNKKGSALTLHRLASNSRGMNETRSEKRSFSGVIEFRIDNSGHLAVINELPLDAYLKGVLPVEMDAAFPLEAHRAQAVAARGSVLSMIGLKHREQDWDFCAGTHCQQFAGLSNQVPISNEAVESTAQEVLLWKKGICDTVYHACCGGHGESKEHIWVTPSEDVLQGRLDATNYRRTKFDLNLSEHSDFQTWLLSPPEWAFCRVKDVEHPVLSARSTQNYRWRELIYRQDLEALILKKTGQNLGTIYAITPIKRGNSGRIIDLEIIGSRKNLRLQKELKIRRALAESLLFSSAFIVQPDLDSDGLPISFTILGAGRGHGVGMCQVGAGGMAIAGKTYQEILSSYYPGTTLAKLSKNGNKDVTD
jgi:stage II sporulation protein D